MMDQVPSLDEGDAAYRQDDLVEYACGTVAAQCSPAAEGDCHRERCQHGNLPPPAGLCATGGHILQPAHREVRP